VPPPPSPPAPSGSLSRRAYGAILLALGVVAIIAPLGAGRWAGSLLGIVAVVAGAAAIVRSLRTRSGAATWTTYLTGVLLILGGAVLFARPVLVISGLLTVVALLVGVDGITRLLAAVKDERGVGRVWTGLNGLVNLGVALLLWRGNPSTSAVILGLGLGVYMLSLGWTALLSPDEGAEDVELAGATNEHPDSRLALPANPEFGRLRAAAIEAERLALPVNAFWIVTLILVFFAIHAGRLQSDWTWLGVVSPLIAVAGDLLTALLVAALLLPLWLGWRRLTRPIERQAWERRLSARADGGAPGLADRVANYWIDTRLRWGVRLRLARGSLRTSVQQWLRAGLPIVAIVVAINPIWGFSWYFNTENWASGLWDMVTASRTDEWRQAMIAAVDRAVVPTGVPREALFEVRPDGVADATDFSFLVIGDPGEGDASQASLRDRYLLLGQRPDVRFLAISSDVIYPDGAARDYEFNFYLPFKGFEKPIYAIPGNHDWYSALDGFAANLMEPVAARAAMDAREALTALVTPPDRVGVQSAIAEAARLRKEYGIRTAEQRGPFFEVHGRAFSLIAVDTGVVRRVDPVQATWFEAALERARGRFTMVILGHPLFVGGAYQGDADEDFDAIHRLLRRYRVPLVMAGDTHDFEYYRETYEDSAGAGTMHHFVNGGGGAYLSIGTALDWPATVPVRDWAYYPSTAAVRAKLDAETGAWKWPVWWWIKRFGGWPLSVEALSGMFDFNRAPFFQSFVEVRVEGSARRVRLVLQGVRGPLRWRDLDSSGTVSPRGSSPDDPAEWVLPMASP
jgi:uncharacterized membrane protein HdeD (DUF308 family)